MSFFFFISVQNLNSVEETTEIFPGVRRVSLQGTHLSVGRWGSFDSLDLDVKGIEGYTAIFPEVWTLTLCVCVFFFFSAR